MKNYQIFLIIGANLSFSGSMGYNCIQMVCVFVEHDLLKGPFTYLGNFRVN